MIYLTVKELKEIIRDLPDDTKVYQERIEDEYVLKRGWEPVILKDDSWIERRCRFENPRFEGEEGEWFGVYEAFYNENEKALKLTPHY